MVRLTKKWTLCRLNKIIRKQFSASEQMVDVAAGKVLASVTIAIWVQWFLILGELRLIDIGSEAVVN